VRIRAYCLCTKDIGAGGFRARPADGALAATGGASLSPSWDGLPGRIGGRQAPRPSIKVRQQLPGRARYVVVVGRQEPAVRAPRAGLDTVPRPSVHMALAAGRAPHRHNAIPGRVTPTATTSATRSRAQRGKRRQPLPGRRRQVQVERASVEHRERVLGVVGGHVGVARACRRRVGLASAAQVSSWNTVSRFPPRSLRSSVSAQQSRLVGAVLAEQHDEWEDHAATSASTSSSNPATTNTHHQNRRPTRQH
jgi:hypothetical protein